MMELVVIGEIHTPFKDLESCPRNIQADGARCILKVYSEFVEGLHRLEESDYVQVLYWFDDVDRHRMVQQRRSDGEQKGIFALRSPHRPNPIGSSVVRLLGVQDDEVTVVGLDCLDGTPLLDIKPAIGVDLKEGI